MLEITSADSAGGRPRRRAGARRFARTGWTTPDRPPSRPAMALRTSPARARSAPVEATSAVPLAARAPPSPPVHSAMVCGLDLGHLPGGLGDRDNAGVRQLLGRLSVGRLGIPLPGDEGADRIHRGLLERVGIARRPDLTLCSRWGRWLRPRAERSPPPSARPPPAKVGPEEIIPIWPGVARHAARLSSTLVSAQPDDLSSDAAILLRASIVLRLRKSYLKS